MGLFRKKNNNTEKTVSMSNKVIEALNYTPVDYAHSAGFITTSEAALNEARNHVAQLTAFDEYIDNYRDSFIDECTRLEIEKGKEQYTNHIQSIISITEQVKDDKITAENMLPIAEKELEQVEEKIKYYSDLQEQLTREVL